MIGNSTGSVVWKPVPILMYHAVEAANRPPQYKHFYVNVKEFTRQMGELRQRGYQAISLDRMVQGMAGETALPSKPIVLTFDDGYANVYDHVHPLLREMNWPYTVYLVSDRVGKTNDWVEPERFEATPLLTWKRIEEMRSTFDGVAFQAHTATHPKLALLDAAQAELEIVEGKARLEQHLQTAVRHFCYPYGSCNDAVVAAVREAGFTTATTTNFGRVRKSDALLCLPRVSIYHVPPFSLDYGPGALNFRWRVESRRDKRPERLVDQL